MAQRYFFIIRYLPKDIDLSLLSGRCISILHGYILNKNLNGIGVSFPDWSDQSIGNSIAFISEHKSQLIELANQTYFTTMKSEHLFSISEVMPVPSQCLEVQFKRNQNIAKCYVGDIKRRLVRAKRRAETRGEVFTASPLVDPRNIGIFHCAATWSQSSGDQFVLHIQKVNSKNKSDEYGNYGLATNEKYLGTVPELLNIELSNV
jgi:CRISPR-associated endonuclease Csy4